MTLHSPAPAAPGLLPLRMRLAVAGARLATVAGVWLASATLLGAQAQSATYDVIAYFTASGWMGDATGPHAQQHVSWNNGWTTNCHSTDGVCVKVTYTPGDSGWGGIYLQYPAGNWGALPGRNLSGYRKLTFWARADSGGVVEFKAGGIYDPRLKYRDSFEVSKGAVSLGRDWRLIEMDLTGRDLTSVIGGFAWVASKGANPRGTTFYLDDVEYVK